MVDRSRRTRFGRSSEAREHVATARGLDPSDPALLRGLAAVERYPDRDDPAVARLIQARELAPEDVATLVALGDAHLAARPRRRRRALGARRAGGRA
ncbi:hypothetical protein BE21_34065 [Sorangium cellulosum]|uniref:Uncharacterized protein n=1 Tax=Sorangium cellulosum TaxID=56 RepID=A0A150TPC0_SORCE|nr:hypothetical protein BE21_34065 [Sorangium cellulosum]